MSHQLPQSAKDYVFPDGQRNTGATLWGILPSAPVTPTQEDMERDIEAESTARPADATHIRTGRPLFMTAILPEVQARDILAEQALLRMLEADTLRQTKLADAKTALATAETAQTTETEALNHSRSAIDGALRPAGLYIESGNYSPEGIRAAINYQLEKKEPITPLPQPLPPLWLPEFSEDLPTQPIPEIPQDLIGRDQPPETIELTAPTQTTDSKQKEAPRWKRLAEPISTIICALTLGPIVGIAIGVLARFCDINEIHELIFSPVAWYFMALVGPLILMLLGFGWKWTVEQIIVLRHAELGTNLWSRFWTACLTLLMLLLTLGEIAAEYTLFTQWSIAGHITTADTQSAATDTWILALCSGMVSLPLVVIKIIAGITQGKAFLAGVEARSKEEAALEAKRRQAQQSEITRTEAKRSLIQTAAREYGSTLAAHREEMTASWTSFCQVAIATRQEALDTYAALKATYEDELKRHYDDAGIRIEKIASYFGTSSDVAAALLLLEEMRNIEARLAAATAMIAEKKNEIRTLEPLSQADQADLDQLTAYDDRLTASIKAYRNIVFGA